MTFLDFFAEQAPAFAKFRPATVMDGIFFESDIIIKGLTPAIAENRTIDTAKTYHRHRHPFEYPFPSAIIVYGSPGKIIERKLLRKA